MGQHPKRPEAPKAGQGKRQGLGRGRVGDEPQPGRSNHRGADEDCDAVAGAPRHRQGEAGGGVLAQDHIMCTFATTRVAVSEQLAAVADLKHHTDTHTGSHKHWPDPPRTTTDPSMSRLVPAPHRPPHSRSTVLHDVIVTTRWQQLWSVADLIHYTDPGRRKTNLMLPAPALTHLCPAGLSLHHTDHHTPGVLWVCSVTAAAW